MANSGGNNESVCDVDMANNEFLSTFEYVIKSVQGAYDDLKGILKSYARMLFGSFRRLVSLGTRGISSSRIGIN